MPDANSIAIVLVATVACNLLAHLRRGIKRWALDYRLRRSLRLAVRREIASERDTRRETAARGEGMAA
jgi:hypothetical protein